MPRVEALAFPEHFRPWTVPDCATTDARVVGARCLSAGKDEILADDLSKRVKQGLSAERGVYLGLQSSEDLRTSLGNRFDASTANCAGTVA